MSIFGVSVGGGGGGGGVLENSSSSPDLGYSPSLFAGILNDEPFVPFASHSGPSSPGFYAGEDLHVHAELLHPEVSGSDCLDDFSAEFGLPLTAPPLPSVPDVGTTDMEQDDVLLNELMNLSELTPEWAKHGAPAPAPVRRLPLPPACVDFNPSPMFKEEEEEEMVPEYAATQPRPNRGPGSRRKVQEEIHDELDCVIYALFPADILRLPRVEFQEWRDQAVMRNLSVPEQKRLAKIRRMVLARVYAERTRLRKIHESKNNGQTLTALKQENGRLRKKAANLEASQTKLLVQVKRLLALQSARAPK